MGLLAFPQYDASWGTASFHFYIVSAASLLSAAACLALILSARTMRETRIMFLALAYFGLAMFFSVHGLTTPGFLFDEAVRGSRAVAMACSRSAAGTFATLSVVTCPGLSKRHAFAAPRSYSPSAFDLVSLYFCSQPDRSQTG